jgi:hypothetical protein
MKRVYFNGTAFSCLSIKGKDTIENHEYFSHRVKLLASNGDNFRDEHMKV